jgi:hypothetical protein
VIRVAPYCKCFRPLMHISKHDGETNPNHWLEDEGSNDDFHCLVPFPASIKLDQLKPSSIRYWVITVQSSSATSRVPTPT